MSERKIFRRVTDEMLSEIVVGAERRLVFIAPGVSEKVAKALAAATLRLPEGAVQIVLDASAEVCRMGYGELKGLKLLRNMPGLEGLSLNMEPGVRIGLVIADDRTLCYAPTPLLLEAQPKEGATGAAGVNGVLLDGTVPPELSAACAADGVYSEREIGLDAVDDKTVVETEASL